MAQTIKQLIQNYTKDVPTSDYSLESFVEYAYKYTVQMVSKLLPEDIFLFLDNVADISANGADISDSVYLDSVLRNGKFCELITYQQNALLFGLYEPTSISPKAYIKDSGLYVNPIPSSTEKFEYNYVPAADVDIDETGIDHCPDKYLELVCLKASIEVFRHILSNKSSSISFSSLNVPDAITLQETVKTLPDFTAPDSLDTDILNSSLFSSTEVTIPETPSLPVLTLPSPTLYDGVLSEIENLPESLSIQSTLALPAPPVIDNVDFGSLLDGLDITFDDSKINTINRPVLDLSSVQLSVDTLSISDLEQPTMPELKTLIGKDCSVLDIDAPSFTSIKGLSLSIPDLSISSAPPVLDFTGYEIESDDIVFDEQPPVYVNTFTDLSSQFSDISDLIDADNDDIELAIAHLQNISALLNEQNSKTQDSLNDFNARINGYQSKLQKAIADANNSNNVKVQNQANILRSHSNNIQNYQVEINSQVTVWQQKDVQEQVLKFTNDIQIYLQEATITFNANVESARNFLQKEIANASQSNSLDVKNEELQLQNFTNELSKYQVLVNTRLSEWQASTVQGSFLEYTTQKNNLLQEFQTNMSAYLADKSTALQNEQQRVTTELGKFRAIVEKVLGEHAANTNSKVSIFSTESQSLISEFSTLVNAEIQEFASNYVNIVKKFEVENNLNLQKYLADVNRAINSFQAEANAIISNFSTILNGNIQKFTSERTVEINRFSANLQQNMQIFQSDMQIAIQEFNKEVSSYQLLLSEDQNVNNSRISKYGADVNLYATSVNSTNQAKSVEVQRLSLDYNWLELRLASLIREYESFFMIGMQSNKQREVEDVK